MSWFNDVTGSNDYERQSWRDSYNGGRAAGDLTGNVNARLDQERRDYQGATWSGSSSEYSALELARVVGSPQAQQTASAGPGVSGAVTGASGQITSGPGASAVSRSAATAGPGASPKKRDTLILLPEAPLENGAKLKATDGYAGVRFEANPWFSDVENWGEPRYGEPGEWLGGILNIIADGGWNVGRAAEAFERTVDRAVTRYGDSEGWGSNLPMAPMGKPGSLSW